MTSTSNLEPGTSNHNPPSGLLNPYFQILLGAALVTASEVLLKKGAVATVAEVGHTTLTGLSALGSPWVWGAIACYAASFAAWLHVLRYVPLNIAFNLSNIVHVLVPLASWIFLAELISPRRWMGISLVLVGIWVIAKPLVTMEATLEKKL